MSDADRLYDPCGECLKGECDGCDACRQFASWDRTGWPKGEHNTNSILCWCGPTRDPIDPEVIVHREAPRV